jgi:hypothetical protein
MTTDPSAGARPVESVLMAGPTRPKFYWSERAREGEVCAGCGAKIDYDNYVAFVVAQKKIAIDAEDEVAAAVEKFWLCQECGTDVDCLGEMGMKRIMGIANAPPGPTDDDIVSGPPNKGEAKN